MHKKCCGMSITLNTDTVIPDLIFKGNNVISSNLHIEIFFVVVASIVLGFLVKTSTSKYNTVLSYCILDICCFLLGWVLMTSCMTANIYIILAVCLGRVISLLIFGKHPNNKCCV